MCSYEKRGNIFLLTITGDDEHSLNPTLIDSISSALGQVKFEQEFGSTRSSSKSVLIITNQGRFFSSGYDLSLAQSDPVGARIMSEKLRLLVVDLISLPMPTIAAVNGDASGAGLILALIHDHLVMRKDGVYLYLNVVDARSEIPNWFMSILKNKIGSPKIWKNVVLSAEKMTAEMGVEWGIVDSAHEGEQGTVEAAFELGKEVGLWKWLGEMYAGNRKTMFSDVLAALASDETVGDLGPV